MTTVATQKKPYTKPTFGEISPALAFLKTVVPEGFLNLRALAPERSPKGLMTRDDAKILDFIKTNKNSSNVYFGVAGRIDPTAKGEKSNCGPLHALYVEWDIPWSEVKTKGVPTPSILIDSGGGGCHGYWCITEPYDLQNDRDKVDRLLKRLAAHVGAEPESAEVARILRVPNTFNHKYEEARPVTFRKFRPDELVDVSLIEFALGDDDVPVTAKSKPLSKTVKDGSRNDSLFREGCKLRRHGYSSEEIQGMLEKLNQSRCKPPLTTSEVEDISRSCSRYETVDDTFPKTETGDAEYFTVCNAEQVCYDHRRGRWLVFDGVRWAPESKGEVDGRPKTSGSSSTSLMAHFASYKHNCCFPRDSASLVRKNRKV